MPQLVFVGLQGWGVGDLLADLRLDPRIKQYVNILNHVTDDDLVRLYSSAYFTVYPSLYEGWGLPVAESLAHGKLCLATTAASVPEVGGTLIDYIDPWDVDSWAQKIQWYCDNPQDLRAREERIRRDYKVDSWSYCAKFILESLKPGV